MFIVQKKRRFLKQDNLVLLEFHLAGKVLDENLLFNNIIITKMRHPTQQLSRSGSKE